MRVCGVVNCPGRSRVDGTMCIARDGEKQSTLFTAFSVEGTRLEWVC